MSDLDLEDLLESEEYCIGYKQGREDADKFLKQWKDDVMESLCKYDANSVEEVYQYGIDRGRADGIEEYRKEMHDMIEGDEEFTDWQKYEILECNELVAEQLKSQDSME